MHIPSILQIFDQLPLPDDVLAQQLVDARAEALKPYSTLLDCLWGPSRDPEIRMRRIAWRVGFRLMRSPSEFERKVNSGAIAAVESSDVLAACLKRRPTLQGQTMKPLAA